MGSRPFPFFQRWWERKPCAFFRKRGGAGHRLPCDTAARPTMILPAEIHPTRSTSLNLELIRKYSIPGPRYTSYPPATKFTPHLAPLALEDAIADDNRPGAGPLSLY